MSRKDDEVTEEHPSYGVMEICRVSGQFDRLFGSGVSHSHAIAFRINRAQHDRHLHNNWYHACENLVEVYLSPTQFAEAITNMNTSPGTPCTIRFVKGEGDIEEPPAKDGVVGQFHEEFRQDAKRIASKLTAGIKQATELLGKKSVTKSDRETILAVLDKLKQDLVSNMPFLVECFEESVEKVVSEAKGEIDAFYQSTVSKMGLAALQSLPAKPAVAALAPPKQES